MTTTNRTTEQYDFKPLPAEVLPVDLQDELELLLGPVVYLHVEETDQEGTALWEVITSQGARVRGRVSINMSVEDGAVILTPQIEMAGHDQTP